MNLEELTRHAVKQLPSHQLGRYVKAYEHGILEHGTMSSCAVGHMMSGQGGYMEYFDKFVWPRASKGCEGDEIFIRRGRHTPALILIEVIFEGWHVKHKDFEHIRAPKTDRRRMIYDACIEELATRTSEEATHEPPSHAVSPQS